MRAQTIDVKVATGRVLCCTVFRAGGKKLLAKGHVISDEDARMLETEGMREVWVTELEEGEVGEDEAVMQVASEIGCGSLEIRLAAGGRANLFTINSRLLSPSVSIGYQPALEPYHDSYQKSPVGPSPHPRSAGTNGRKGRNIFRSSGCWNARGAVGRFANRFLTPAAAR